MRTRRSLVRAWRFSTPTGSATRPARRPASIRTSGAGTRPVSRSPTPTSTRPAPRRSYARSSRANGATASCRTSASRTEPATSPAPSSGRPSSRRTRRRTRGRRGSSSRPSTRPRSCRSTATPPIPSGRRRSSRELMPRLAAWHDYLYRERTHDGEGLSRSGTRGSRASTTRRSGTRLSHASLRRRRRSPTTSGSTPRSSTRRSGRRTPSTTATPTSSSAIASGRYDQAADPGRVPVRDPGRPLQLDPRAGGRGPRVDRARGRRGPRAVRACCRNDTVEPRLEALERGERHVPRLRPACRTHIPARTWGGLAPLYCGVVAGAGEPPARDRPRVRRHAGRRLGRPLRVGPAIPSSTRPATGAGRSGP